MVVNLASKQPSDSVDQLAFFMVVFGQLVPTGDHIQANRHERPWYLVYVSSPDVDRSHLALAPVPLQPRPDW